MIVFLDLIEVRPGAQVFCTPQPSFLTRLREWLRARPRDGLTLLPGMSSDWLHQFQVAHWKQEPPL